MEMFLKVAEEHQKRDRESRGELWFYKNKDYTLRVDGVTFEECEKVLSEKSQAYVIGEEGVRNGAGIKLHCHCVFKPWCNKKELREYIKESFKITDASKYSLKLIRKTGQTAVCYAIKRGEPEFYLHGGMIDLEQFEMCEKMSHGKGRTDFKHQHEKLKEEFFLSKHKNKRFIYYKKFYRLKILFNQKIYPQHIKAHCIQVFMRADKEYFNDYVDTQWENSGLMTSKEQRQWNDERYN